MASFVVVFIFTLRRDDLKLVCIQWQNTDFWTTFSTLAKCPSPLWRLSKCVDTPDKSFWLNLRNPVWLFLSLKTTQEERHFSYDLAQSLMIRQGCYFLVAPGEQQDSKCCQLGSLFCHLTSNCCFLPVERGHGPTATLNKRWLNTQPCSLWPIKPFCKPDAVTCQGLSIPPTLFCSLRD